MMVFILSVHSMGFLCNAVTLLNDLSDFHGRWLYKSESRNSSIVETTVARVIESMGLLR
jgi:hypothetical protein